MNEKNKRTRRTTEEILADLEAQKQALLAKAEVQKVKDAPAYKPARMAISAIDKGLRDVDDPEHKAALEHARETLGRIVPLEGIRTSSPRKKRSSPAQRAAKVSEVAK